MVFYYMSSFIDLAGDEFLMDPPAISFGHMMTVERWIG
jgi:hypothetical protein